MDKAVIEVKNFSYSIGRKPILRDLSLSVKEGEYLSIIGPNGAGKSTFLKCLTRIYTGVRGTILIKQKPLESYGQKALARVVSYVPQAGDYVPPFTVGEFVLMGRYPRLSPFSLTTMEDKRAVEKALEMTGTEEFESRQLSTLSGGERQKVFIAAALAQSTEILLLDEPTTFLDPKHQYEINSIIKRINTESGVTVLSVTHDINSAVLYSKRVLALKHGRVAFHGAPGELMNNLTLSAIYDKTFTFAAHPETGAPLIVPEAG